MLVAVAYVLSAALTAPLDSRWTRRGFAAALIPVATLQPSRAAAGLFGPDGPQGEFRAVQLAQTRLNELATKLKGKELRGDKADDAIVVLQTITVQISGTSKTMDRATAMMPLLEEAQQVKAQALSARLDEELAAVKQGCREQDAEQQLRGVEGASSVLGEYLSLASSKYTLPVISSMDLPPAGSKEFIAQYMGVFSCEGQGLERIPGSNSCKDPPKKEQNRNPLPSKNLLDFDMLTGKPRP